MDIIDAFIGWKRLWKAQTSVARGRLGIRDAQEPSRATYADPSEGCIIKMCFWRIATDVAEPTAHIGCSLLLYYEGFKCRSEGEERLVGEQDNERTK
jgi:hypothetical protein